MCRLVEQWAQINSGTENLAGLARLSDALKTEFAVLGGDLVAGAGAELIRCEHRLGRVDQFRRRNRLAGLGSFACRARSPKSRRLGIRAGVARWRARWGAKGIGKFRGGGSRSIGPRRAGFPRG